MTEQPEASKSFDDLTEAEQKEMILGAAQDSNVAQRKLVEKADQMTEHKQYILRSPNEKITLKFALSNMWNTGFDEAQKAYPSLQKRDKTIDKMFDHLFVSVKEARQQLEEQALDSVIPYIGGVLSARNRVDVE